MNTKFILQLVVLLVFFNGLVVNNLNASLFPVYQSPTNVFFKKNTNDFSTDTYWYLELVTCAETEDVACCCCADGMDGNQRVCSVPTYSFVCRPNGIFECSSDLSECQGNPSECMIYCCNTGRADGGGGGINPWGIFTKPAP